MTPRLKRKRLCAPLLGWLLLLLSAAQLSSGLYLESHPACGYDSSAFFSFSQTPELQSDVPSLGVCNHGIAGSGLPDSYGQCLQCSFTPVGQPTCQDGFTLVNDTVWSLAPSDQCQFAASGCVDVPCPSNTLEAASAMSSCGRVRTCCPLQPYYRCCSYQQCSDSRQPAGNCVSVDTVLDLLPGQTITSMVYVVPVASSSCAPYAFNITRTCQPDRSFPLDSYYETCVPRTPKQDKQGCPLVPGYTLRAGLVYSSPTDALVEGTTRWQNVSRQAAAEAGSDPLLMAGLCSLAPACAAFDTSGALSLRSYVPTSGMQAAQDPCDGVYVRNPGLGACPRLAGYLYTPRMTLGSNASLCSTCSNMTLLAQQCSEQATCTGFSTAHGLLYAPLGPSAPAGLYAYTDTPCRGLYSKVGLGADLPYEVEQVDSMLCGATSYCSVPLQYEARSVGTNGSSGYAVWMNITLTANLDLPSSWTGAATAVAAVAAAGATSLPNVQRLVIECRNSSRLSSALPQQLPSVFPNLQQLSIVNCLVDGMLPPAWASLAALRVLDLSNNALTGPLPPSWGSGLRLGYLSLAFNDLTGSVPASWVDIILPPDSDLLLPGTAMASPANSSGSSSLPAQALLLLADLSYNKLGVSLPRQFVSAACLDWSVRLEFSPWEGSSSGSSPSRLSDLGTTRFYVFYGNYLLQQWAGYPYAWGKAAYSQQDHTDDMCGAYK